MPLKTPYDFSIVLFSAPKNQKPRKPKASELKRTNKKLLENEKADKDDSSSTTTETSSIEADEKVQLGV